MKVKLNESWQIDGKLYTKGAVIDISQSLYESAKKEGVKIEEVKEKKLDSKTGQ